MLEKQHGGDGKDGIRTYARGPGVVSATGRAVNTDLGNLQPADGLAMWLGCELSDRRCSRVDAAVLHRHLSHSLGENRCRSGFVVHRSEEGLAIAGVLMSRSG